jgi:hypothetical protein
MAKAISQALIKMLTDFLTQQAENLVASKTTAATTVATQAGVAGAAGVASMAAAPWPLDLGAPAFGASMFSDAMGYQASVSAAGGFDIPAGINPVVQAHAEEMVLPKSIADTIREMAATGQGGGAGRPISVHVHANDGDSVASMLMSRRGDIAKALARHTGQPLRR